MFVIVEIAFRVGIIQELKAPIFLLIQRVCRSAWSAWLIDTVVRLPGRAAAHGTTRRSVVVVVTLAQDLHEGVALNCQRFLARCLSAKHKPRRRAAFDPVFAHFARTAPQARRRCGGVDQTVLIDASLFWWGGKPPAGGTASQHPHGA